MKHGVARYEYLLRSILLGDKKQALAILKTLNEKQVYLISEIFHNLLLIPQSQIVEKILKRNKKLIIRISNPKISAVKRLRLINKNSKLLLKVLHEVKKQLLDLIKNA